jgi:hypothetical protein
MGVTDRPRVWSFVGRFRGRFRMKPTRSWMPFDAWQYNCTRPVTRVFDMRIDAAGVVPMFGSDTYLAGKGRMHGRVLGLVTVADGEGPEFDLGELITYVNDALMLTPSMLLSPATQWLPADDTTFDITFTDGPTTVTGRAFVDDAGRLRDFRTVDRWYAGTTPPVRAPWTTPVTGWSRLPDGRPLPLDGAAVWQLPDGDLTYVRGSLDPSTMAFNIAPAEVDRRRGADRP